MRTREQWRLLRQQLRNRPFSFLFTRCLAIILCELQDTWKNKSEGKEWWLRFRRWRWVWEWLSGCKSTFDIEFFDIFYIDIFSLGQINFIPVILRAAAKSLSRYTSMSVFAFICILRHVYFTLERCYSYGLFKFLDFGWLEGRFQEPDRLSDIFLIERIFVNDVFSSFNYLPFYVREQIQQLLVRLITSGWIPSYQSRRCLRFNFNLELVKQSKFSNTRSKPNYLVRYNCSAPVLKVTVSCHSQVPMSYWVI